MKRQFVILIIAAMVPLIGLATPLSGSSKPTVRLSQTGRIYVGEKYTGLRKLVSELKSSGISKKTRIVVEIPDNTSADALASISKELRKGGYRRFCFTKPRKATAERGVDPFLKHMQRKRSK
jgi:biopolymer transport protein ExbD